ncbi:MAG: hypothetical protein KGH55_02190 [Nanoarchaeota archaeon]|nr:hypothetical protein [Nanoarchaeota archaeon]
MVARANSLKNAEEDYAKENKRKEKIAAELGREKADRRKSLMNSYAQIEQSYQSIIASNPGDPRLRELYAQMVRIRDDIKRLGS